MSTPPNNSADHFVFRKHDHVGAAAAEEDSEFLNDCFVDTGDVRLLLDCSSPKRIIVGRTGAGKSALIYRLTNSHPNVYSLSPHDLSLNFIATNRVIAFFEEAGVNLEPFYVLLWKHLLVVELLKRKFSITNQSSHQDFMGRLKSLVYRDAYKEMAVDYLNQWGDKFWLTTEERIRELTDRVEKKLGSDIGAELGSIEFSAESARILTTEERRQVVQHGLDAVSRIQIRELDNMITVLAENVFEDPYEHYYITIDMLDENWADERIRFKLIRALIDAVRRFGAVPNIKIILALRQDLLDKVLHLENVPGFQEEKYKTMYLNLQWSEGSLKELLERRIQELIRHRYTKQRVAFHEVFPARVDESDTLRYLLDRTFYRPRDLILFVNECIELADSRPAITAAIIKQAEARYSVERLRSVAYEWSTALPYLQSTIQLLYGQPDHFPVSEITERFVLERYPEIAAAIGAPDVDLTFPRFFAFQGSGIRPRFSARADS